LPADMPFEDYRKLLVADGPCAVTDAPSRRGVA